MKWFTDMDDETKMMVILMIICLGGPIILAALCILFPRGV